MTAEHWTLRTPTKDDVRLLEVVIYDALDEMRADAVAHSIRVGDPTLDFSHALGICQGFTWADVADDGTDDPTAIVRFTRGSLSAVIVAHEMIHAAQHIYQHDYLEPDSLANDHIHAGNEDFTHLAGELVGSALALLSEQIAADTLARERSAGR